MKADVIAAALAGVQAAQTQALSDGLGAAYDGGVADTAATPAPGGLTQADVDAAVKAATDPLNTQIAGLQAQVSGDADALSAAQAQAAQALADAQAKAASDLAGVQSSLDAMTAKEGVEEGMVTSLQGSISQLQASSQALQAAIAALAAFGLPVVAPVPAPAQS